MSQQIPVTEYASPNLAARAPLTCFRITWWLGVTFGVVFCVSRWLVPVCVNDYRNARMSLPGVTMAFLTLARPLGSVGTAVLFLALTIALPMAFVRMAFNANAPPYQFAYRRLVAIHLITGACLIYLLIAAICLMLPYVILVRDLTRIP